MLDLFLLCFLRIFFWLLGLFPLDLRIRLLSFLIRSVMLMAPGLQRVSLKNLKLAFPGQDPQWYQELLRRNANELARLLVDFGRLQHIDQKWISEHVQFPFAERMAQILRDNPQRKILVASGHLGSFELLGHAVALMGYPLSFVVRDFKLPMVDSWWRGTRERYGNRVISRKGAFKEVLLELQRGRIVGLLFDQNVTRNHAVFVPWFGRPAATSKTLALAALRTEALVLVVSLSHLEGDQYRIEVSECDCSAIYNDSSLSLEEKVFRITERATREYEKFIANSPQAWFWMHRRWKTTPAGVAEDFYD